MASESVSEAGSGLVFVNTYDASVTSAYRNAIVAAEDQLESDFTNAVTVNVSFSYAPIQMSDAAENDFNVVQVSHQSFVSGAGPDMIFGDLGHNTLTGGDGANTFVGGAGVDTITDLNLAQRDRIEIASTVTFTVAQSGADVQINLSNGGEMILQNVQLASLGPTSGWVI